MLRTLYHAYDPGNWVFRHNLWIHKGKLPALSAIRQTQPELADALSPYEAFTRERPKEDVFEEIRVREFPYCPPRLGSYFLFLTRESAEHCNAAWWGGTRKITEARIFQAFSAGVFDSRLLDAPASQWGAAARRYWAGKRTADPRLEAVVCGVIEFPDWQSFARLGP